MTGRDPTLPATIVSNEITIEGATGSLLVSHQFLICLCKDKHNLSKFQIKLTFLYFFPQEKNSPRGDRTLKKLKRICRIENFVVHLHIEKQNNN